jgi:hypothetical protein
MKKMINLAVITSAAIALNGCATMAYPYGDQPRTPERQAKSDQCWGLGKDNTALYLATLVVMPVICVANDLTRGQAQVGSGSIQGQHIITPQGTYSIISSHGLTTVHKTTK